MSEQKGGAQAHYFGRWLAGYVGTNPQYRSCTLHFGQGIVTCSADNVSNVPQPQASGNELTSHIAVDGLVTYADGEIVVLVKLETGGLGRKQIEDLEMNPYRIICPPTF